jgi:4-alpha-glucanotransferase
VTWELIRLAWSSSAALAIAPLQDLLNLGAEGRMNIPGRAEGNWAWSASETMFADPVFQALSELTSESHRDGTLDSPSVDISGNSTDSQETLQNCA